MTDAFTDRFIQDYLNGDISMRINDPIAPLAPTLDAREEKRRRLANTPRLWNADIAVFDKVCLAQLGHTLSDHAVVRHAALGALSEPAAFPWPLLLYHCGLSDKFMAALLDALLAASS